MINKIKKRLNILSNMGTRYVLFRILYLLKTIKYFLNRKLTKNNNKNNNPVMPKYENPSCSPF